MNKVKHTPTPWKAEGRSDIEGADIVAVVPGWSTKPVRIATVVPFAAWKENAALIVEAVNNYEQVKADRDDLLLALKMQQERHKSNWDTNESCYVCDVTRAAISQVERHKQKGGE